jgi:hypothetical protein
MNGDDPDSHVPLVVYNARDDKIYNRAYTYLLLLTNVQFIFIAYFFKMEIAAPKMNFSRFTFDPFFQP